MTDFPPVDVSASSDEREIKAALAEQALEHAVHDEYDAVHAYTVDVMLPPLVQQGESYPWYSIKARPFGHSPARKIVSVGRGWDRVEFNIAEATLVHWDVHYGEDRFIGPYARKTMLDEIVRALQGTEVQISICWQPGSIQRITAQGVQ